MSDILDYPSRVGDPASQRLGTFSYLPAMDPPAIRRQVAYALDQGWTPAIEHVEPERAAATYWYMWKLPMFGEGDADVVVAEVGECLAANPGHHIRLIGYDSDRQTQGFSIVVHRGTPQRG